MATPIIERLNAAFPEAQLDFLLRKGNESLLKAHPKLNQVLIWDKSKGKYKTLMKLIRAVRTERYDAVINLQRFGATGLLTWLSKSKNKIGFDKNPFSFSYNHREKHEIGTGKHEVERNLALLNGLSLDSTAAPTRPKLYPSEEDFSTSAKYSAAPFICIAPTSVWFTKQLPANKWIELIHKQPDNINVYLLGAPSDHEACDVILQATKNKSVHNLCGKLSLLQSAALMQQAQMNYVNDSAPMHMASAMNAPVTVFFCSTVPAFGFGPLSDNSRIIETKKDLQCRPCGLHGFKTCPKGHFECATTIDV